MNPIINHKMGTFVLNTSEFETIFMDLLSNGGSVTIVVTGSSMMPLLKPERDSVVLRKHCETDLHRGRILLFRRLDGTLVLHRVRRIKRNGVIIMNGDAQVWCETIHATQIVAVVSEFIINGKRLSHEAICLKLWNLIWYPTILLRPSLHRILRLLLKIKGRK